MQRIQTLLALVLVAAACAKPQVNEKNFEGLYRAAKKVQASLAVGLTLAQFGELQQELATELSIAGDKAVTDKERELLRVYGEALVMLQDSTTLWKKQIEGDAFANRPFPGEIDIDKDDPTLKGIVAKYGVKPEPRTHPDPRFSFVTWEAVGGDTIQKVWARARERIDQASKLFTDATR